MWQVEKLGHATDWGRVHTESMHSSHLGRKTQTKGILEGQDEEQLWWDGTTHPAPPERMKER